MNYALIAFGLILLVVGAELLVRGASRLALSLGIAPLVVGLTVVAFGTSAPEMAVSCAAALKGEGDLSFGNVVGSNIFNVLFILGASAAILPCVVERRLIWVDVPVMIFTSLAMAWMALDGSIGKGDALALLATLVVYTLFLIRQSRKETLAARDPTLPKAGGSMARNALLVVAGLGVLVFGSQLLVKGAVGIAHTLGVSELVIGLTIVAAGTSLPEVATSILATVRGEPEIAVGNVIGSNIFNVLGVLGVSGVLSPHGIAVSPAALGFDVPVMLATAFACLPILATGHRINRWEGILFLAYYIAYTAYIVLAARRHDALAGYSHLMMAWVLPLTGVTLAVVVARSLLRRRRPQAQQAG